MSIDQLNNDAINVSTSSSLEGEYEVEGFLSKSPSRTSSERWKIAVLAISAVCAVAGIVMIVMGAL